MALQQQLTSYYTDSTGTPAFPSVGGGGGGGATYTALLTNTAGGLGLPASTTTSFTVGFGTGSPPQFFTIPAAGTYALTLTVAGGTFAGAVTSTLSFNINTTGGGLSASQFISANEFCRSDDIAYTFFVRLANTAATNTVILNINTTMGETITISQQRAISAQIVRVA